MHRINKRNSIRLNPIVQKRHVHENQGMKDKDSELLFRWQHCALTQQQLQPPIVGCGLGKMYNKDAILEALLDKSTMPDVASHIKSLKDMKDLNLTDNPAYKPVSAEKGDAYVDRRASPYICPVIGLEMNGKFKFCFLWKCGCVLSERSLKEVKTTICHKCQQPFSEEDVVVLNPTDEDLDLMRTKMEARQARAKAAKKAKRKIVESQDKETAPSSSSSSSSSSSDVVVEPCSSSSSNKKSKLENGVQEPKSGKLVENGVKDMRNGKLNGGVSRISKVENPAFKKASSSYSVAKDPKASEVFKSLFTSHKTARGQQKAHWITYNPFYN